MLASSGSTSSVGVDPQAVRAFIVEDHDAWPRPADERQILELLRWARSQPTMKVHPGVVAKGSGLMTSMPVAKGTPLIGVMPQHFLEERPSEEEEEDRDLRRLLDAAPEPERWPLRLALRLLKESRREGSPFAAYVKSLEPRPASLLLWSMNQAGELMYFPLIERLKDELLALRSFHQAHLEGQTLSGASVDLKTLASFLAVAWAGAVEVEPGRQALLPLISLAGPPEGPVAGEVVKGGRVPPASCELGAEPGVAFLTAARDLAPGEALTRDCGLEPDELLLRHGLPTRDDARDDVATVTRVNKDDMLKWQLNAFKRTLGVTPDPATGSLVVRSHVRRGKKLKDAIDERLLFCTRVLSCEKEDEFAGGAAWLRGPEAEGVQGLAGLTPDLRRRCLTALKDAIGSTREAFQSTKEQDIEFITKLSGHRQVAAAFRLEKKRIIDDVLVLLERISDREVERRAVKKQAQQQGGSLPSAVTGASARGQAGFASARGGGDGGAAARRPAAKEIKEGVRVQVCAGSYEGRRGVVVKGPSSLGYVTLRFDNGEEKDLINAKFCRAAE